MIKVIAFDLDNTLYDHEQYVIEAYKDISCFVSLRYNIEKNLYFKWLIQRWREKGSSYNKIFYESYIQFRLNDFQDDINMILNIYHNAKPELKLYNNVANILNYFKEKHILVLITDGKENTQRYKIEKLELNKFFKNIYISATYGNEFYKPSTKLFELCMKEHDCNKDEIIYIGDNPILDCEPCKNMGITFIRMLKGEYKNIPLKNQYSTRDFLQLKSIIIEMEK